MAPPAKGPTDSENVQLATFVVARFLFGIDVLRVQEVLRFQKMTRVPLAPPVIVGLINLRGQIVPAIDMRCRLSLAPRTSEERPMNLVVRTEEAGVSLLVDEIGDVLELNSSTFESTPANVAQNVREMIRGVYKLKNQLLFVLDTDKTVDIGLVAPVLKSSDQFLEIHQ
jgi:purine-binding chemotaxis protein CheW